MTEIDILNPPLVMPRNDVIREKIVQLETNMRTFKQENGIPDPECPLTHTFAPGTYVRTIFVPKNTLIVTKIHKYAHVTILIKGAVLVATEEGLKTLEAPLIMTTKAGTKRAIYCKTDVLWSTVHATDKTDLDEIEDELIAKSYAEFDAIQEPEVKELLVVMNQEVTS
jgi:hypothetical protein